MYIFRRGQWHPTPVLLPGKSHGRRSLVGCSPCGLEESDTAERFPFHFSLSCIGEGNGNPLQCSCLENPRDGGACWAAVSGVAQSRTWLKRLSSSSSSSLYLLFDFFIFKIGVLQGLLQGINSPCSFTFLMMGFNPSLTSGFSGYCFLCGNKCGSLSLTATGIALLLDSQIFHQPIF